MSQITEFLFPSSAGNCHIHCVQWLPDQEPYVGVIQLVHGIAEHIKRYDDFARFLNRHGYVVVGHDHLGHGTSVGSEADRGHFADCDGWTHAGNDIRTLQIMTARQFPGLPYFLFGHSMGSFLTRTHLIRFPGTITGAILCGTGQMSPVVIRAGRVAAHLEAKRLGLRGKSQLLKKLSFGSYNKKFEPVRTDVDWLSLDHRNVDNYINDPLCGFDTTVGLFLDLMDGLALIRDPKKLTQMDQKLPVFFIAGDQDPVGDFGKGVKKVYQSFQRAGLSDLSLHLYPGLRHEILNETNHETIYGDVLHWLETHRGAAV